MSRSSFKYSDAVCRFAMPASTTFEILEYGWTKINSTSSRE